MIDNQLRYFLRGHSCQSKVLKNSARDSYSISRRVSFEWTPKLLVSILKIVGSVQLALGGDLHTSLTWHHWTFLWSFVKNKVKNLEELIKRVRTAVGQLGNSTSNVWKRIDMYFQLNGHHRTFIMIQFAF